MNTGEIAAFNRVFEDVTRGGTFYAEYELRRDGSLGVDCQVVEAGSPINGSEYTSVSVEVQVPGLPEVDGGIGGAEVFMVDSGSDTKPAVVGLRVPPEIVGMAFDDGAFGQFTFQIELHKVGVELPVVAATVDVIDSAGRP